MLRIRLSAFAIVAAGLALVAAACTPPSTTGSGTNKPPVATAAATPTTGPAPLLVAFSSAGSHDPDGTIASYSWSFGDGSPTSSSANPTKTYNTPGVYNAVLTVADNHGAIDTATVTVTVTIASNQSPHAAAAASPDHGHAPLSVAFSSAGSSDPDGSIASYSWDFGDGSPPSTNPDPTHTYNTAGTPVATLTVTDNQGATNSASVTITVGANDAPTAAAGASPDNGKVPLEVAFSSAGSSDPDGTIASYSWDFGDGSPLSTDPNPTHTYTAVNTFTATLTVTDNGGATGTASIPVSVVANQAPTAAAAGTPSTGRAPLAVAFSSAGSSDPDGTIASYSWDFGDGSPLSTDPNPTHVYAAGTHTAVLTVTDNDGATATASVAVDATVNTAPTAVANSNASTGVAPATIVFDASGTVDPDGSISGYAWNFGDSTSGTGATVSHTYATAGTYAVTLTVTDNEGATATDTHLSITVTDDPAGRYVATTGTDTGTCASSASPCSTVNYAVAHAATGDTIHIAAGTYPEMVEVSKNVVFKGPNAGIDGASASRGPEAVVQGFTNAYAGSITGVSSTTYNGTITNATNTSAISSVAGGGVITYASGAGTITGTTGTGVSPIVVTTSVAHGLNTGDTVTISGVVGNTATNGSALAVTVIDPTHFSIAKTGNGNYTSGGAYKSAPVVLTTSLPVPFTVGSTQSVTIAGLVGNTAANGAHTVTVTDSTHLTVTGVTGNGPYTSGGTYSSLAIVTTATPHGLATGAKVTITGVVGATGVNQSNKVVTVIDATHFSMAGVVAAGDYTSGGTVTTPNIVFTTGEPITLPYSAGLTVAVSGVAGNTAANGTKAVTVLDTTHFIFTSATAPSGDYTGGGTYTSTPMIATTSAAHGITGNASLVIGGVEGDTAANSNNWTVTALDTTHLLLVGGVPNGTYAGGGRYGQPMGGAITAVTNASPIVVTTQGPNGLSTGQSVTITGETTNTAANGTFQVTVIDATHFSLDGSTGNGATGTGTYTGALLTTEVNGVEISPQGDVAWLRPSNFALTALYGGPSITIRNTVFDGGAYDGGCSFTCTTMADYALDVRSGTLAFGHNLVTDFRRPLNLGKTLVDTTNSYVVDSNTFTNITSRAVSNGESTGVSNMSPTTMTNNTFADTGLTVASTPAAIILTDNANVISGNTISGFSSGVFIDVCKKYSTRDNQLTGNTFTHNGSGIYVFDDTLSGQCSTATVGGDVQGMTITSNNFVGNGNGVVGSFLTGIDASCNWWGVATGPNTAGADTAQSGLVTSPWAVASEPGGSCSGS